MGGDWMIGKFATASAPTLLLLTFLLGAQAFAQTTPADQTPAPAPTAPQQTTAPTPAAQPSGSGQEPAEEEPPLQRKASPHDYKNWNFNVGGGANMASGTTKNFVRSGGWVASAGVARNASKYLGLRADFIFADLPLRQSTLGLAEAGSATSQVYALTLDPIINIPVTSKYSGYVLFGPGFYHRTGKLSSDNAVPGSQCSAFWDWWGACLASSVSIPVNGSFVKSSLNELGYNFGGGLARKVRGSIEIYAEYRLMHGSNSGITTDFRPITVGVRW